MSLLHLMIQVSWTAIFLSLSLSGSQVFIRAMGQGPWKGRSWKDYHRKVCCEDVHFHTCCSYSYVLASWLSVILLFVVVVFPSTCRKLGKTEVRHDLKHLKKKKKFLTHSYWMHCTFSFHKIIHTFFGFPCCIPSLFVYSLNKLPHCDQ